MDDGKTGGSNRDCDAGLLPVNALVFPFEIPQTRALTLDVTDASQIQQAVGAVDTLDVLINNAGIAIYDDVSNLDALEQTFAVNFFGLLKTTNAFLPLPKHSKRAILNNLSMAGLAPLPIIPSYSTPKAAALNLTQSLRALLASQAVQVMAPAVWSMCSPGWVVCLDSTRRRPESSAYPRVHGSRISSRQERLSEKETGSL